MSKKLKLSPWHDGSVKPVHVGVYEVDWYWDNCNYEGGKWFNFWDGARFRVGNKTASAALSIRRLIPKKMKPIRWRGVLK